MSLLYFSEAGCHTLRQEGQPQSTWVWLVWEVSLQYNTVVKWKWKQSDSCIWFNYNKKSNLTQCVCGSAVSWGCSRNGSFQPQQSVATFVIMLKSSTLRWFPLFCLPGVYLPPQNNLFADSCLCGKHNPLSLETEGPGTDKYRWANMPENNTTSSSSAVSWVMNTSPDSSAMAPLFSSEADATDSPYFVVVVVTPDSQIPFCGASAEIVSEMVYLGKGAYFLVQ